MDASERGTARDESGLWLARIVGLGVGLTAVLGAILLGWLAWPALFGGSIGGGAFLVALALTGRRATAPWPVAPAIIPAPQATPAEAPRQAA